jgi:hypothetical protein
MRWILIVLLPLIAWTSTGCSDNPPSIDTKVDIQRLPTSQGSVNARSLADRDIASLARFKELRILDFSAGWGLGPAKITDEGLAKLAKLELPHLETLTLGWCDEITDAGLKDISRIQTITFLGLPSCPRITDAGLSELVHAKGLKELDLRGCPNITDEGIQRLASSKANWETIDLGGCPKITSKGVAKLQAALPNAKVQKDDAEWGFQGPDASKPPWRKP